jgi:nucleotide-binding universal stress UspA family protein
MYKFKRIMIALDLSYMDEVLLKYATGFCNMVKPDVVYFINIQPDLDLDEDIKELLGGYEKPSDELLSANMKKEVEKFFSNSTGAELSFKVVEGNPSQEILRWTKIKDVDLLVMGRKDKVGGSGITPQQVSSKVMSSVLIVPEGIEDYKLKKIFVPVDFSEYSELSTEAALQLQERNPQGIKVKFHHVYNLPLGYEKSGKTSEEFSEIMKTNAMKKFEKMKTKFQGKLEGAECTYELATYDSIGKDLKESADKAGANLIIMGAKGRTLATQIFLGSATEKLIKYDSNVALLVAKDKNTVFDFWNFFKSI